MVSQGCNLADAADFWPMPSLMASLLSSLVTSYTTDDTSSQEEAWENVALLWPRPTLQLPLSGLPSVRPPSAGSTEGGLAQGPGEERPERLSDMETQATPACHRAPTVAKDTPASPALETWLTWY